MARRRPKRKTLPKNFAELLKAGDLAKLKAVFETCDVNAHDGGKTALAFDECPDELARWLASEGADLSAVDSCGNTPLHTRARSWSGKIAVLLELGADVKSSTASIGTPLHAAADGKHADKAAQLLARGAEVEARNKEGLTPLALALHRCTNADLVRMPALVNVLLGAGAVRTAAMKSFVERLGQAFELHREAFNPERLAEADAALDLLYQTFEVGPVPRRHVHDGKGVITVKSTKWQEQHAELWKRLVPSRGPAKTVQGEVIRVSGRISDEWERNGGANWDRDYADMARALTTYVEQGTPLDPSDVAELKSVALSLSANSGRRNERLAELAVAWVLRNPQPLVLEKPSYGR